MVAAPCSWQLLSSMSVQLLSSCHVVDSRLHGLYHMPRHASQAYTSILPRTSANVESTHRQHMQAPTVVDDMVYYNLLSIQLCGSQGPVQPQNYHHIYSINLSFWRRTQEKHTVDGESEHAGIGPPFPPLAEETEHQGEDDASDVAHRSHEAAHSSVVERVAVRNLRTRTGEFSSSDVVREGLRGQSSLRSPFHCKRRYRR